VLKSRINMSSNQTIRFALADHRRQRRGGRANKKRLSDVRYPGSVRAAMASLKITDTKDLLPQEIALNTESSRLPRLAPAATTAVVIDSLPPMALAEVPTEMELPVVGETSMNVGISTEEAVSTHAEVGQS
jgi:hypothetical protein